MPEGPIELRVYPGADSSFTLYEDENDGYDYEKGVYTTISIHWNDSQRALTIGERRGHFPGMLEKRTLRVVFVGEGHGTGLGPTDRADQIVQYEGSVIQIVRWQAGPRGSLTYWQSRRGECGFTGRFSAPPAVPTAV